MKVVTREGTGAGAGWGVWRGRHMMATIGHSPCVPADDLGKFDLLSIVEAHLKLPSVILNVRAKLA